MKPADLTTHAMPEDLSRHWVEKNASILAISLPRKMRLDFAATRRIDSAGSSFVHVLHKTAARSGKEVVLANASPEILSVLTAWQSREMPVPQKKEGEGFFARTGEGAVRARKTAAEALSTLTEMLYWGSLGLLRRRDFKKGALGEQMYQLGYRALGIVVLLSFVIGVVLALQSAIQLRTFGAGIFLAPMIGISMIREIGPLMTAIILAGRTGSATTAEIATMGVGEELDALQTMGINPVQFVVVPKFWAISITMPLLSIISTATGIFGGYVIALTYLDISSSLYWGELSKNIFLRDFAAGFIKSVVFSWLIIWIGAYFGFRVRGGAEEVGRETTACVVSAIFAIIVADAVLSFFI